MVTESAAIWTAALLAIALIVLAYIWRIRRRERQTREDLEEARRLGIDKPKGQFPFIDPEICLGCGACVRSCPEGDVLGLAGGLAVVVNGVRCLGIAQCEKACPVGAIEIGTGNLKGRADVPVLDENLETNVPGIFVVGELGGLALIRNAVGQGREAVHGIADRSVQEGDEEAPGGAGRIEGLVDLAIVGAGPSGLSAALTAVERGLSYVVLEQAANFGGTVFQYPRRKLTHTQPVELPLYGELRKDEYTKEELLELFETLVEEHKLTIRFGEKVLGVDSSALGFQLQTRENIFHSRKVVLALGRRGTPRKLGVPGEDLPKVMYQVRDAAQYRRRRILCVGGGDSAVEAAMGLVRQPGNEVFLSYRKEQFFRIKKKNRDRLQPMLEKGRIRALMSSNVLAIEEERVLLATEEGEVWIDNDFVFIFAGGLPPFPLLREMGIRFGADEDMTNAKAPAYG